MKSVPSDSGKQGKPEKGLVTFCRLEMLRGDVGNHDTDRITGPDGISLGILRTVNSTGFLFNKKPPARTRINMDCKEEMQTQIDWSKCSFYGRMDNKTC